MSISSKLAGKQVPSRCCILRRQGSSPETRGTTRQWLVGELRASTRTGGFCFRAHTLLGMLGLQQENTGCVREETSHMLEEMGTTTRRHLLNAQP